MLKKSQIVQGRPNVINQIRLRVEDVNAAGDIARRIERQHGYQAVSWDEAERLVAQELDRRRYCPSSSTYAAVARSFRFLERFGGQPGLDGVPTTNNS